MKLTQYIKNKLINFPITFTLGILLGCVTTFIVTKDVEVIESVRIFDIKQLIHEEIPKEAIQHAQNMNTLGLDIYQQPNKPAIVEWNNELPVKFIWGKYVTTNNNENDEYLFHLPLYANWKNAFYPAMEILKVFKIENPPDYFFVQYEMEINQFREMTLTLKSSDVDLHETLGPFPIFKTDIKTPAAIHSAQR